MIPHNNNAVYIINMTDSSTQTSLLKTIGAMGGVRVSSADETVTGNFMAIHAIADTTILANTVGNIDNLVGMVIAAGDVVVGEWTTIRISGEAIIYKG
jgi:hypothetical protein